ncbi:MAG: hypothetical protein A4E36_01751 [Methanoregulaceae archaeon PtaB.Bin009]|nr:MAG: hypothetical protein A4E36_01751 [Methanoregulaceae archaeon PtaB.Bin009]
MYRIIWFIDDEMDEKEPLLHLQPTPHLIPGDTSTDFEQMEVTEAMDQIEKGYRALLKKIDELDAKKEELSEEVRTREAELMGRMGEMTAPLVSRIGMNMLKQGKQDTKGEMYDTRYHDQKMIILGKTDPVEHRPDNISKKVDDQFCVLSEDGKFYELMFSTDGIIVDSYRNPLSPADALQIYGHEIMVMLYRAMRDYMEGQKELLDALEKTIAFVLAEK